MNEAPMTAVSPLHSGTGRPELMALLFLLSQILPKRPRQDL